MKGAKNTMLAPVASILAAASSVQAGAIIAKGLFPLVGVPGTVAARITVSAIILLAVFHPPMRRFTAAQWKVVIPYGITIGLMNLLFYQALFRIPLGLAVTLEFVGPLAVAVAGSRRARDAIWILLAAIGIALIAPLEPGSSVDPIGVMLALLTGACWAAYIVLGSRVSQRLSGGVAVATGMLIAALTVLPFAVAARGRGILEARVFVSFIAVAVLSSALPYTLEMRALRLLPGRTFSILMSLEPAIAALCGLILLGERLTGAQWSAVGLVTIASIGAILTARTVAGHADV